MNTVDGNFSSSRTYQQGISNEIYERVGGVVREVSRNRLLLGYGGTRRQDSQSYQIFCHFPQWVLYPVS